ncbi:MAG: GNAT family N-acetyltransferase [Methanobacterium paludis]|nr:GNAT family N-acetyltransferase [Methanobacterium paludis]
MKIIYIRCDGNSLDSIQHLWDKLRQHHHKKSENFREHYKDFDFQDRKETLLKKSAGGFLRVDLAKDVSEDRVVGYCVSSISSEMEGEVDSIYVEEEYRSEGIGGTLMQRALSWMDENEIKKRRILVANGNDKTLNFYVKYGFYPRATVLEQKEEF